MKVSLIDRLIITCPVFQQVSQNFSCKGKKERTFTTGTIMTVAGSQGQDLECFLIVGGFPIKEALSSFKNQASCSSSTT